MRTVKYESLPLNKNKMSSFVKLSQAYANQTRYWLNLLLDWDYQAKLGQARSIRDEFVDKGYTSHFGLQARHWKLSLQDAIDTWDKYWQAIFLKVRKKIARSSMSEAERHYAYWLLKGYSQFAEMMQGRILLSPFEVETRHKIASFVQRTVKAQKGYAPSIKKSRIVKFDANCYEVFENDGRLYIKLMTLERGKRLRIPLRGKGKIEGNITVVLGQESLQIHVSQELKPKALKKGQMEAVDFGYTEVITDTEGVRYGTQFGEILTKTSNDLHEKMQKRHKIHALQKKEGDPKKARDIRKFNLGRKKQKRKKQATKATLEREINTAINTLVKSKNPPLLITENLSHLFTYNKPKAMNRKLSSWLRGRIQDRVSFKALAEGFRHEQVNPAYGSQICLCCDYVDRDNRRGDRFKCLYCGHEDMADRVGAVNYAKRLGDSEIGLYTPYSQVKTILLGRFHRRLEKGEPLTVPGRTLETVSLVHPPPSRDEEKSHSREGRKSPDRAVTQRAKKDEYVSIRF